MITLGSESFYIISNNETNIEALAQYNLYVGKEETITCLGGGANCWTTLNYINPSKMQRFDMNGNDGKGYAVNATKISKGLVKFSNGSVEYSNSIIKDHVDIYKKT